MGTLSTEILEQSRFIVVDGSGRWIRMRLFELHKTVLTVMDITKQIEIMVEEICQTEQASNQSAK